MIPKSLSLSINHCPLWALDRNLPAAKIVSVSPCSLNFVFFICCGHKRQLAASYLALPRVLIGPQTWIWPVSQFFLSFSRIVHEITSQRGSCFREHPKVVLPGSPVQKPFLWGTVSCSYILCADRKTVPSNAEAPGFCHRFCPIMYFQWQVSLFKCSGILNILNVCNLNTLKSPPPSLPD